MGRFNVSDKIFEAKIQVNTILDSLIKGTSLDEYEQNTINDFYPDTISMLDDLLELTYTKLSDFLRDGELYTRTRVLEICSDVILYVKHFALGKDFQGGIKR